MTPKQIPNGDLQVKRLPRNEADWDTIQRFALTFDAYSHWGSFDRCAEIAESRRRDTLTDVRTCLFFEQRRWRHYGEEPDMQAMIYIRALIEEIRTRVAAHEV